VNTLKKEAKIAKNATDDKSSEIKLLVTKYETEIEKKEASFDEL
jgi:hypothetical protein